MKQSDKEFLCYLICLSWDRLDDSERIRASKIISEITDREDNLPDDLRPDYVMTDKLRTTECSTLDIVKQLKEE